ncbi:MAG TPA: hypothetical protein VGJ28_18310 [Micromonosporaceae bacterium]|jgi:hypothetical protein
MVMTPIYLEAGKKKVFACAVDWPGWSRSGKTDEDAIEALADYADRYAPVAAAAGVKFPAKHDFQVIERVPGTMTTDFGAPGEVPDIDRQDLTKAARARIAALVGAAWTVFDEIAAATPAELRKGPRGGGRDRDKMIDHVYGAEVSYLRKLGVKHKQPAIGDTGAITAIRTDALAAMTDPPADSAWPMRYLARRLAWHVLDHAWEMQDKSTPS